jgi:hypothetical protein
VKVNKVENVRSKNLLKAIFLLAGMLVCFPFLSQNDSLKTIKVKKPYVFDIADFYSLITVDTNKLSSMSEKYYPGDKGIVAGKCNNNSPDEVLNFMNPEMMTQVCFVNGKIQSVKVRFNKDNYKKKSVILSQLANGNFNPGMTNKSGTILSIEYINITKNLFIEIKCNSNEVVSLRFN